MDHTSAGRVCIAGLIVGLISFSTSSTVTKAAPPAARASYGKLTAAFVRNVGQVDSRARFIAVGGDHPVFFTDADIRIVDRARRSSLWLTFVGGAPVVVEGDRPTDGTVTYLNPRRGMSPLTAYGDVVYRGLWPGVDAKFTANSGGGLEYAFEIHPGHDPRAIRLRYDGATSLRLTESGDLEIDTEAGPLTDHAPVAYQQINGRRVPVRSRFLVDGRQVTFDLGDYDAARPLIIDPTLVYSSYLGGSGYDAGYAIAVDPNGAAYVAGTTRYLDFPTTPGAFDTTWNGGTGAATDAFVAKMNPAGDHFDYVTYLGGSGNDEAFGIAVDAGGNAYVTGYTESADFPATPDAFRTTIGIGRHDGFVTKLNAAGSALVYSTLLGANGPTNPAAVAVDAGGSAFVTGDTSALNLPSTPGNVGPPRTDNGARNGFLLKLNPSGSNVSYGTYLGGIANGIAVDGAGHAFVTGYTISLDLRTSPGAVQPLPNSATFKSTDRGDTFTPVNGGVRATHVISIAIDPLTPSIVYEGTDESREGLLKSTDGGATWSYANNGFGGSPNVYDIAINPIGPTTLLAATSSGLFRSLDAGANWVYVAPAKRRVAFAPSDPSIAYATNWNDGAYRSSNGGASWTQIAAIDARSLAIDPNNSSIVYIGNGGNQVMRSANGGASWTTSQVVAESGWRPAIQSLAVDPSAPNTVYAGVASGAVYKSTNSGTSWACVCNGTMSDISQMVFDRADGNTLYMSGSGEMSGGGGLARTTNGGATWRSLNVRAIYGATAVAAYGGTVFAGERAGSDGFVYKIDTTNTVDGLVYGTHLGGSRNDAGLGIALDPSGNAVVVASASRDFPVTVPASPRNTVVARLDATGGAYTVSSFVGPPGSYVATYGVAVDHDGTAYVTGYFDDDNTRVYIDRVDTNGLVTNEYFIDGRVSNLGIFASDGATGIAVDAAGDVYITGTTVSVDYPTTPNAPQRNYGSGASDAIISKVSFADVSGASQLDRARGRPAVASSIEAPQYAAGNAVDGNDSTRWSSQFNDPQWIYVDLGERIALDHIIFKWETAFGSEYSIQVSDDASSWVEIRHQFSNGGTEVVTNLQGTGRYVRMFGMRRGTQWGYSLWSFEVYGNPATEPPSSNLALNRPSAANSAESGSYPSSNAFDGRGDTRFSSAFYDPQWVEVDIGGVFNISRVVLKWETAYGADYQIQARDSLTSSWRTLATVTNGDGGVDDLTGLSGTGRYIRMYGTRRGTPWGYSLWEFEVYGSSAPSAPQPAAQ